MSQSVDTSFTPLATTLNRIWAQNPCPEGWDRGLKAAGKSAPDDEPILYVDMARSLDLRDALWCCRAEPQFDHHWRLFAVWCVRQVQYLLTDQRSLNALDVAERHARGEATDEELAASQAAASDAARDAASDADWAAASDAAWAAARDAASDADWAAARDAASDAAWAAWAAARRTQKAAFIQLCETGTLPST